MKWKESNPETQFLRASPVGCMTLEAIGKVSEDHALAAALNWPAALVPDMWEV